MHPHRLGAGGLDRYAYVNNSPMNYVDPSGHEPKGDGSCYESNAGACFDTAGNLTQYGISFEGSWSRRDKSVVNDAVIAVGKAIALASGTGVTPADAFRQTYTNVNFTWSTSGAAGFCQEMTGGGCTSTPHQINFATLSDETISMGGFRTSDMAYTEARNNVVHELGHAFAQLWYNADGTYNSDGPLVNIESKYLVEGGFHPSPAEAQYTWRQHPVSMDANGITPSEIFADMFLGWTFNKWEDSTLGYNRRDFMNEKMPIWVK